MNKVETYQTIAKASQGEFKDRGSRFIGYAFRVKDEKMIQDRLDDVRKEHHAARHHCYAWVLGPRRDRKRANDDGEPSNSAGKPILAQIEGNDLSYTLIIVVRYFGGTKLGVGGLIQAYKQAAKEALDVNQIIEIDLKERFSIETDYEHIDILMRLVDELELSIIDQQFLSAVKLTIDVPLKHKDAFLHVIQKAPAIKAKSDAE